MPRLTKSLIIVGLLLFPFSTYALSTFVVPQGGTGSSTLSGILNGNGTAAIRTTNVSAPLTFSGTTLAITQASRSINGYLSSTDFTTFDNKISSTSLSATSPIFYNSTTGVINSQAASASQNGYLVSTDYSLLHAATTTFSAPLVYTNSTNAVTCTTASAGVTGCLSGTDWSTFNNKQATISATWPIVLTGATLSYAGFGTTTNSGLPVDQILYTNHAGVVITAASSSLSLPNAALQNSSVTVNTKTCILGSSCTVASTTLLSDTNKFSTAATTSFTGNIDVLGNASSTRVQTKGNNLAWLSVVYSTSTPGSNVQIQFTGAINSAPSFSAGVLTLPNNVARMEVELYGAGGGGGGGDTAANTGGSGTAGGNSCFGTNSTACTSPDLSDTGGGGGGQGWVNMGGGTQGGASGGDLNFSGSAGDVGKYFVNSAGIGGAGGSSHAGGAGRVTYSGGQAGGAFGNGGGGGVVNTGLNSGGGGGGGAGGYSYKLILNPSGSYYYTVGAGGAGGAAGTSGTIGGAGGAGGFILRLWLY